MLLIYAAFYSLNNFDFNALSWPYQYPIATSNWKQKVNVLFLLLPNIRGMLMALGFDMTGRIYD